MENPFKKIGRAVGIASISALSVFPGDKKVKDNVNKDKTEWTYEELDTDEERKNLATFLVSEGEQKKIEAREKNNTKETKENAIPEVGTADLAMRSERQRCKDLISFLNEAIDDYNIELIQRDMMMPPKSFAGYSKEELAKEIEEFKKSKAEMQTKLDAVNEKIYNFQIEYTTEQRANSLKEVIFAYDEGRKWVLDNMNNPEYKKRLSGEFEKSGIEENADLFSDRMIEKRGTEASKKDFLLSKDIQKTYEEYTGVKEANVGAFYVPSENSLHFPLEINPITAKDYAIHEYSHKVTKANELLTPRAIELLSESFDSTSVAVNLTDIRKENLLDRLEYFSDPTEMYARKKQFDYELEKVGIKKYGEKFTLNHFIKALKLKSEGKLDYNSVEFINSVKPRNMIKVMNEIAEVDTQKESGIEQNTT